MVNAAAIPLMGLPTQFEEEIMESRIVQRNAINSPGQTFTLSGDSTDSSSCIKERRFSTFHAIGIIFIPLLSLLHKIKFILRPLRFI